MGNGQWIRTEVLATDGFWDWGSHYFQLYLYLEASSHQWRVPNTQLHKFSDSQDKTKDMNVRRWLVDLRWGLQ